MKATCFSITRVIRAGVAVVACSCIIGMDAACGRIAAVISADVVVIAIYRAMNATCIPFARVICACVTVIAV